MPCWRGSTTRESSTGRAITLCGMMKAQRADKLCGSEVDTAVRLFWHFIMGTVACDNVLGRNMIGGLRGDQAASSQAASAGAETFV